MVSSIRALYRYFEGSAVVELYQRKSRLGVERGHTETHRYQAFYFQFS